MNIEPITDKILQLEVAKPVNEKKTKNPIVVTAPVEYTPNTSEKFLKNMAKEHPELAALYKQLSEFRILHKTARSWELQKGYKVMLDEIKRSIEQYESVSLISNEDYKNWI